MVGRALRSRLRRTGRAGGDEQQQSLLLPVSFSDSLTNTLIIRRVVVKLIPVPQFKCKLFVISSDIPPTAIPNKSISAHIPRAFQLRSPLGSHLPVPSVALTEDGFWDPTACLGRAAARVLHPISFTAVPAGLEPSLALAEHKKNPSVFWQKYKPLGALWRMDVKCFTSILRSPAQLLVS